MTSPLSDNKYCINDLLWNESKIDRFNISADINVVDDDKFMFPLIKMVDT